MQDTPVQDLPVTDPKTLGLCPERLERVDGWMRRLVAEGKLAGLSVMLSRRGETAFFRAHGLADIARATPFAADTITRIYSMTKPLTSVAVMMLYEEGRFQLDDPITRFLPEFTDMRVFTGGNRVKAETVPAERPITIRDCLTHTAGFTYGFMEATLVDALYRQNGVDFGENQDASLAEVVARLARQPLLAQPGAEWNYSVATDLLGHLVAVVSGQDFGDFLKTRVIDPLGMVDTDFHVPADKVSRLAANYSLFRDRSLKLYDDAVGSRFASKPATLPAGAASSRPRRTTCASAASSSGAAPSTACGSLGARRWS